ncbi:hypothetical protein OG349_20295 [Streptomyces sp. NBC_01317]|uniref:hypothetical protein n=1 Tax=Streptomyces sp. NBC_01317 TaxID=2903822 RepID=UPI002E11C737|nr:hypothetical protein OG349_20295 [Streptomyces sp. NBC_01317]
MTVTPNQQTDLRKVFYQCRLGRDDLERMFVMACEGIESPDVKISTVSGSTRFWNSTLADLVAVVQVQAAEPGDEWSNLSLEAKTSGGERHVSITIDIERTEFNVSGSDAVWAYGQSARLDNFLTKRGAVTQSPKYEAKVSLLFVSFFLLLGYFFFFVDSGEDTVSECVRKFHEAQENSWIVNSLMGFLMTLGLAGAIVPMLKRRALRAQLRVDSEIPGGGWWFRLSVSERIAVVGVPVAILAAIGAIMSGLSDVLGK